MAPTTICLINGTVGVLATFDFCVTLPYCYRGSVRCSDNLNTVSINIC